MGTDHTGALTKISRIKTFLIGNFSAEGRQIYLDILRAAATVSVIAVHTVSLGATLVPAQSGSWYAFEISNYLFLCCNLLFIMMSGALLLPVKGERAVTFYKKRFLKVLMPMVVYYIFYVCAKEGLRWLLPDHWLALLKRMLFGPPEEAPHFWLMYVILGLYLLTPLFRFVLQRLPDWALNVLVAAILLFYILYTYCDAFYYNPVITAVSDSFAGTFLMGFFLSKKHGKCLKRTVYAAGLFSVVCGIGLILCGKEYHRYIFNHAPLMVFYAMAVFLLIKDVCAKKEKISFFTVFMSRYSFGILLIHWGVLHFFVKQVLHITPLTGGFVFGSLLMIAVTLFFSSAGAVFIEKTILSRLDKLFCMRSK